MPHPKSFFALHTDALIKELNSLYPEREIAYRVACQFLEKVTEQSLAQLLCKSATSLSFEQETLLKKWVIQLTEEQMPLQYVLGSVRFGELTLTVRPPTLIPRPETEWWTYECIKACSAQPSQRILDLCTGSGCIALALAHAFPQAYVEAVDISQTALALARENAELNNLQHVNFLQSDLFDTLPSSAGYDLITANPPYITYDDWKNLDPQVRLWEDPHALHDEGNGLALIQRILIESAAFLIPGGELWLEIGAGQAHQVEALCTKAGLVPKEWLKDFNGHLRTLRAFKKN